MNKKKVITLALLLLPVALLSSCSGQPFSDQDFIAKLFPNGYWDFLIQLIAFVLLILIVDRLAVYFQETVKLNHFTLCDELEI